MAQPSDLLRQIPKVDELLLHSLLADSTSHTNAADAVREVLDRLREEILAEARNTLPSLDELATQACVALRRRETPSLRRVINATGVVLHTNLGRAPLSKSAVEAVQAVAMGYSTLEYQVESGRRGSRYSHVEELLLRLTGAEAALVVNNNASAVLLALSALVSGREVIVSRGELVEIGGAFRIPDVMAQSGAVLREVGSTNRTRAADYERAIDPERTGALFKAHTSNFRIIGFTEEVSLDELVALGRQHGIPVIHDLGSGALLPPASLGLPEEPGVLESIASGADLTTFSGDKLLGGPQAGILLGRKELIDRIKKHPLTRAVRIDKMTLAALEATLRLYLDPERAIAEIPTLRMLTAKRDTLRPMAERLQSLLSPLGSQVQVTDTEGQVGGGSAPGLLLPSSAVEITPEGMSVDTLEQRLRECPVPIVARIARDRLLLDVRTLSEEDFAYVAECLNGLLKGAN